MSRLAGRLGVRTVEQSAAAEESASILVQRAAQDASDKGVASLLAALSPREAAAYARDPLRGARFLGQATHRQAFQELETQFKGRFQYFTRGADFYDSYTQAYVELTTPASVAAHLARPGYQHVAMATYTLP